MDLEYLTVLEKRVQMMIALIKTLREENQRLASQLREDEKSAQALRQERGEVRERVEEILKKLQHLNDDNHHAEMEQEAEQAPSY